MSSIYSAIRPSGREPELEWDFPALSVSLRPYQRRAAAWMVAREVSLHMQKAVGEIHSGTRHDRCCQSAALKRRCSMQRNPTPLLNHPLWQPVPLMDSSLEQIATVAYNPFSGCFSREYIGPPPPVHGGILAGRALAPLELL